MSMSIASEAKKATSLVPAAGQGSANTFLSLPLTVRREIERLTELLFFTRSAPHRRSVVLVEMDAGGGSSLWLATGIATVLCRALRQTVYVLSLSPPDDGSPSILPPFGLQGGLLGPQANFVLETISEDTSSQADTTSALTDRLATLQSEGHPVIVHLPHMEEQAGILARASTIEGVVLLTRASLTRRAALEAIERRLAATGVPLLGSVLLDRVHPIPEKLYRLL